MPHGGCTTFLETLERAWRPWAPNHPGSNESHIPFSLYGDECVLGNPRDKVTAMFLQLTLFKPKSIRLGHFMLFCIKDEFLVHNNLKSLSPILDHLTWSANQAMTGYYPHCDAKGQPFPPEKQRLAGKPLTAAHHKFSCVEFKGDWKWHERVWRLRATPSSKECCFLCGARAEDGPLSYSNISDDAPWMSTMVTTPTFLTQKVRRGLLSALDQKFVRLYLDPWDLLNKLHILQHLGSFRLPTTL